MFEAHFQTFEEAEGGVALTARLARFREELAKRKLTGFVIPRADQQQNEYVAPSEERLAWLTGFTGSAGMAIVLTREAAVFVDGRYTLQAAKQVDGKAWNIEPLVDPPPEQWLSRHLAKGDRLGFDPWLHTSAAAERLAAGRHRGVWHLGSSDDIGYFDAARLMAETRHLPLSLVRGEELTEVQVPGIYRHRYVTLRCEKIARSLPIPVRSARDILDTLFSGFPQPATSPR